MEHRPCRRDGLGVVDRLGGEARAKMLGAADGYLGTLVEAQPGYVGTPHEHVHAEFNYVISGACDTQLRAPAQCSGARVQSVTPAESALATTARRAATCPSKADRPVSVSRTRTRRRRLLSGRSMLM